MCSSPKAPPPPPPPPPPEPTPFLKSPEEYDKSGLKKKGRKSLRIDGTTPPSTDASTGLGIPAA